MLSRLQESAWAVNDFDRDLHSSFRLTPTQAKAFLDIMIKESIFLPHIKITKLRRARGRALTLLAFERYGLKRRGILERLPWVGDYYFRRRMEAL